MKVREIYEALNSFAPFNLQEKWDNSGILVGDKNADVKKALLTLDVTEDVIKEAEQIGANLIISHHPLIFNPLKKVLSDSLVYKIIKKDMNVISAHTNLDISPLGVNYALAEAIGLKNTKPLTVLKKENYKAISVFVPVDYVEEVKKAVCENGAGEYKNYSNCTFTCDGRGEFKPLEGAEPFIGEKGNIASTQECEIKFICPSSNLSEVINAMKEAHPYEVPAYNIFENEALFNEVYIGLVGECKKVTARELAKSIKNSLGAGAVRLVNGDKIVEKLALCSGSGIDFIGDGLAQGADAYLTGDVKHNHMVDALNNDYALIDAGHFPTENIVLPHLKKLLEERCSGAEFFVAKESKDPSEYI